MEDVPRALVEGVALAVVAVAMGEGEVVEGEGDGCPSLRNGLP